MNTVFVRLMMVILAALILSIIPLPEILTAFRPPWIPILILYIQFFLPRYFNFILLFILGCTLDVLDHSVMGEHAFAMILIVWMASTKARRMQFFSMGQQMALVGFFCLVYQLVIVSMDIFSGFNYVLWMPFASAGTAMFFWPWLRLLLDDLFLLRYTNR